VDQSPSFRSAALAVLLLAASLMPVSAQQGPPTREEMAALDAEMRRVCLQNSAFPEVQILKGKISSLTGDDPRPLQYTTNTKCPTEKEKAAILAMDRASGACRQAFGRLANRTMPPGGEVITSNYQTKRMLLLAYLYEGALTYGEYHKAFAELRRVTDEARTNFINQYVAAANAEQRRQAKLAAQRAQIDTDRILQV